MTSLVANMSVPASTLPTTDALWSRNWVYCPHNLQVNDAGSQEPAFDLGVCKGSISKHDWLQPQTRAHACARELISEAPSSTSVNFCLMNSQTGNLCKKMASWVQRTEYYLCQAAGICEESDFFYSPTTFNLQEKEFVFDTVQRFYTEDAGIKCPALQASDSIKFQQEVNEAIMEQCSSVTVAPFLLVVEQIRAGKRNLVLLTYHWLRVVWRLLEVYIAVTADNVSTVARQASNAVQVAADALLKEVTALMMIIGDFVEEIGSAMLELVASKGVGSTFKEIILAMCRIFTWFFNNIWVKVSCPITKFILEFVLLLTDVFEVIINALKALFIPTDVLETSLEFSRNFLNGISDFLNECKPLQSDICEIQPPLVDNFKSRGTLPMPTRCWSSYVTFFGDNQQLSCTSSDTCKSGALSSDRVMCGACPVQTNPNIQDFACDYVTSICTCAVPQLRDSSCLVNEDCMDQTDETTCMLVNDNLELSRSSILCSQCQFQRMCFHNEVGNSGVCACGTRARVFQTCTPQDAQKQNSLSLMLNNLCIYSSSAAQFYEIEFAQTSVIGCLQLDPTTATCAYVVDSNMYIVRGYSRTGRRLLSVSDSATTASESASNSASHTLYSSLDPTCRDALVSNALPNTRAICQANYDSSQKTLTLLGLEQHLPACTFCSFADALDATQNNPIAVIRLLTSSKMVMTILRRHGPSERALTLLSTLQTTLGKTVKRIAEIADSEASLLVNVHKENGNIIVNVNDQLLPSTIAKALESWIYEMIVANSSQILPEQTSDQPKQQSRRLLSFQELAIAVESRVRNGWDSVDRLHEAFAESITQILTYRTVNIKESLAEQQWGRANTNSEQRCEELMDLLKISIRVVRGIRSGWLTLTHERNDLQGKPHSSLSHAWPKLSEPHADNMLESENLSSQSQYQTEDRLIIITADIVNATMIALEIQPTFFYNVFYSLISSVNQSFTCPYESVQTCSQWKVRLWHGFLVVTFYFLVVAMIVNAVGLSFVSAFLIPLFSIVLLQICYGYTWTCLPMVPVCAWQDFTESINAFLPLSLEIPDDLKKTDVHCLEPCAENMFLRCLPRYPSRECIKSCKQTPFAYTSASSVAAFVIADLGSSAINFALNNSRHIPFIQHKKFDQEVRLHQVTLERASDDLIRAHRLCAGLSSYMLLPYLLLILLLLNFIWTTINIIISQIYPLLLFIFSLFTATASGEKHEFYEQDTPNFEVQKSQTVQTIPSAMETFPSVKSLTTNETTSTSTVLDFDSNVQHVIHIQDQTRE
jgi:hypothetical protein